MMLDFIWKMFMPKVFMTLGGLFGGGGGEEQQRDPMANMAWINKPPYTGQRPYSGADVGLGADQLKPLSEQYIKQIMERSRGEGQVGFDQNWYDTRKKQGLGDLAEQYREGRNIRSSQASGQGLRGGIPLSIEQKAQEDYGDTTGDFLDKLTTADLEARREDINKATYAQPSVVTQGANIQNQRAGFDLNEYNDTMPILYEYPQEENTGSGIGDIFGGLLGGGSGGGLDLSSILGMFGGGRGQQKQSLANAYASTGGANKSMAGGTSQGWLTPQQLSYQNSLQTRY